jgi:uncharacterized protein YndB with AHSA1/START domain
MTTTDPTRIDLEITIDVPVEHAFATFTERFDEIKPREQNLLAVPIARSVLEPHVGGTIHDVGTDGTTCAWARVLAFEPPTRLVFSWDLSPMYQVETDPDRCSEVEVTFSAVGPEQTRVQLQHRHLDRHGEGWESFTGLGSGDGWPLWLDRYRALATAPVAR